MPDDQKSFEALSYEELRAKLEDLPMTWYPDLIRAMVLAGYRKRVWQPFGASRFIQGVEQRVEDAS